MRISGWEKDLPPFTKPRVEDLPSQEVEVFHEGQTSPGMAKCPIANLLSHLDLIKATPSR